MLKIFDQNPGKARRVEERVLEGMREVGVLLVAFTPLDAAFSRDSLRDSIWALLVFGGFGVMLFAVSLVLEWRSEDER